MKIFRFIPLMGIVLLLYNVFALNYSNPTLSLWSQTAFTIALPSNAALSLSYSSIFILFALFILFIELVKSTTASNVAMIEQTLSTFVFVGFLLQLFLSPHVAEPTFFILMTISFVEVMAGFIILLKVARRDFGVIGG